MKKLSVFLFLAISGAHAANEPQTLEVDLPSSWSASQDQAVPPEPQHSHDASIAVSLLGLVGDSYSLSRTTYSGEAPYDVNMGLGLATQIYLADSYGKWGDFRAAVGGRFFFLSRSLQVQMAPSTKTVEQSQSLVAIEVPLKLEWVPSFTSNRIASWGLAGSVGPLFGIAGRSAIAAADSFNGWVVEGEMFFLIEGMASDVMTPRVGMQVAATRLGNSWVQPRWSVGFGIEI